MPTVSEDRAIPLCYLCKSAERVKLLGTASIPLPPKSREVMVNYLDAGLTSLGVLPLTDDRIASMIYFCQRCNLMWRSANLSDPTLASRLDTMGTVRPELEETWLRWRSGYFRREFLKLKHLMEKTPRSKVAYLDIGCSYGHLLDLAHESGWQVAGVDASKPLIDFLTARKSYPLFSLFLPNDPLPFPDNSFDLITFYDSFYMLEDPLAVINHVYDKLKPGGYLLLRMVNRNHFVRLWLSAQKLLMKFQKKQHEIDAIGIVGDTKYSYSINSFKRLIRMSKFRDARVKVRLLERGKKQVPVVTRFVYIFGLVLSWAFLKKVVFPPSFTVYVQKESQ